MIQQYHTVTLTSQEWDERFDDMFQFLVDRDGGRLEVWIVGHYADTVTKELGAVFEDTCMFDDQEELGERLMDHDYAVRDMRGEYTWSAELRFWDKDTAMLFKLMFGGTA